MRFGIKSWPTAAKSFKVEEFLANKVVEKMNSSRTYNKASPWRNKWKSKDIVSAIETIGDSLVPGAV